MSLALTVEGYAVDNISVAISSEDLTPPVIRSRTLDVSNGSATVSATERGLPAGAYTVGCVGERRR